MESEERAALIKAADSTSYAKSAEEFARLTERYSDAVADRMLDLSEMKPVAQVLDIGTGSGLIAMKAAQFGRDVNVTGIDQSVEMLIAARANADAGNRSDQVAFKRMDAENLDLADHVVDVVTSLYVLRHLPSPAKAVAEAYRVLKNGGRAVIAVGAPPSLFSIKGVGAAIDKIQDRVLEAAGRRAVSPGALRKFLDRSKADPVASHAAHHSAGDVSGMCRAAGFRNVRKHWFGQSFNLTPDEFWEVQAVFDSEARSRLEPFNDQALSELRGDFLKECRTIAQLGGKLVYRTGAEIVVAVR